MFLCSQSSHITIFTCLGLCSEPPMTFMHCLSLTNNLLPYLAITSLPVQIQVYIIN